MTRFGLGKAFCGNLVLENFEHVRTLFRIHVVFDVTIVAGNDFQFCFDMFFVGRSEKVAILDDIKTVSRQLAWYSIQL